MNAFRFSTALLVMTAISMTSTVLAGGDHEGDIIVARTLEGQLAFDGFDPDHDVILLSPASGLFNGWAANEPGFDALAEAEPDEGLYPLESGCQIRLELVTADPAFKAITPSFTVIDTPGEQALLGGDGLHIHLTWLIDSQDTGFDPVQVLWRVTFKLVDTGSTGYVESQETTFYFANVECQRGDCNGDGDVDGRDIGEFVAILFDPLGVLPEARCSADVDRNGFVTLDDVAAFVERLLDPAVD